jgi:DNA-binding CsgD family transcriptional regulator
MQGHNGPEPVTFPRRRLTLRECQVARLASYGLSNRGIAEVLDIPPAEVARHLDSACAKLRVNSRSALESAEIAELDAIQAYRGREGGSTQESAIDTAPPEHIRHVPGARKPDPLTARTPSELEDHLRSLWAWAGRPSSRKLADRSGGAFSHATVNKLIHEKPTKPALKLEYVLGFVRACGADRTEQQRWIIAWRAVTGSRQSSPPGWLTSRLPR